MRKATLLAFFVIAGCEQLGGDTEPQMPAAAGGGDPTPVLASTEVDMLEDPNVPPPADWDGTGVLNPSVVEDRKNAPAWARNEAEVIDREGQRFLLATGVALGIDNPSLAQTTAENRARAVLARYLNTQRLVNAHIVGTWQDASTGAFYARAEIEVPSTFMPKNLPPPKQ